MNSNDTTSPFLVELRKCHPFYSFFDEASWRRSCERTREKIIEHQLEFPSKIRPVIHTAAMETALDGRDFCNQIFEAVRSLLLCVPQKGSEWNGIDSEVDTEDQLEIAIRLLPIVLQLSTPLETNGRTVRTFPIFLISACLKSVRFVPLIYRLGLEFQRYFPPGNRNEIGLSIRSVLRDSPLRELCTNDYMEQCDSRSGDEFDKELDATYLSVLVDLKHKNLTRREDVWNCIECVLHKKPSRTDERLRFLVDWNPSIFLGGLIFQSFLNGFTNTNSGVQMAEDDRLNRFQTLLELGLMNHPREIGYIFHKSIACKTSCFEFACEVLGKEKVETVVNKIILKSSLGRHIAIRKLVIAAAASKEGSVDALYFFVRQNQDILFRSFQ